MEKIFGASAPQNAVVKVSDKSYILFYGYGEEDGNGYNYRQRFDHMPSVEELRNVIEEHINKLTQERILTGYEWNGKTVWLSNENQQNYTTDFLTRHLPAKVRVYDNDTDTIGEVVSIESEEELDVFYQGMVRHVRECVESGWSEKDGVDYESLSKYEE